MKDLVILSIVPTTRKIGWAVYRNGSVVNHGAKRLSAERCVKQCGNWLCEMIVGWGITHVVVKDICGDAEMRKDKDFCALAKMQGVAEYLASANNIGLTLLNPLNRKSWMLPSMGKCGNVRDSLQMMGRVWSSWHKRRDVEADAMGIVLMYIVGRGLSVVFPSEDEDKTLTNESNENQYGELE